MSCDPRGIKFQNLANNEKLQSFFFVSSIDFRNQCNDPGYKETKRGLTLNFGEIFMLAGLGEWGAKTKITPLKLINISIFIIEIIITTSELSQQNKIKFIIMSQILINLNKKID